MRWVRAVVPYTLAPLSLIACALASAPWLRAFPAGVLAVPLFGAALLSVLIPLVVVGIGVRQLWVTALIDAVVLVFYELIVTLREPSGYADLYNGLLHGPAQILSFALPLVSPRTLLVAPVALCWISGSLVGECVARGWQSVLPYITLMVTFGLSYAGTARAVSSSVDGRRYDTLFAGALLLAILLLRAAQAWVGQEESAETTQPDGILPLRGLALGAVLSVAIAAAAAGVVQSSAFAGRPVTPARVPPVDQSRPLTPVAFIADLRPDNPRSRGEVLFRVSTNRPASRYIAIASVDYYDGDGWSFTRTFRPSGGVIPADPDPAMRPSAQPVTQQYQISGGPMTTVPWMPHLDRAQRVTGVSVDIDSASGMIVPSHRLRAGDQYAVTSLATSKTFDQLNRSALIGTSASQIDTSLANGLSVPLGTLITSLAQETGTPADQPIPFLQAVVKDFRTKSALAGGPASSSPAASPPSSAPRTSTKTGTGAHFAAPGAARPSAGRTPSPSLSRTPAQPPSSSLALSPSPSASASTSAHTGGTTFADVLASIRLSHSGTPEQFATLTALIARKLNVPARVVSGFRIPTPKASTTLPAGTYQVTTADSWTWVEIPIRGLGWVVLDPSPGTYANQAPEQGAATTPSPTPTPTPSQNALLTHSNGGGHAVAPASETPHAKGMSAVAVVVIVLLVVFVVAVLLLVFLLARKQVRAGRRRRRPDPRQRLLGAWQESIDVLVEAGLPDLTCATSAEVAAATGSRFGNGPAAQVRYVGEAANAAIFSPLSPIGPADADAAWRAHGLLGRSVRRRLRWRDRVRTRLRYNRPKRAKAQIGPTSWAAEIQLRSTASRAKHPRTRWRGRRS